MEVTGVSQQASTAQPQNQDLAVKVQKKAMEIEKQNAQQLLEALPDPSSPVGHNVNIKV